MLNCFLKVNSNFPPAELLIHKVSIVRVKGQSRDRDLKIFPLVALFSNSFYTHPNLFIALELRNKSEMKSSLIKPRVERLPAGRCPVLLCVATEYSEINSLNIRSESTMSISFFMVN